jgi:hypothetical protein
VFSQSSVLLIPRGIVGANIRRIGLRLDSPKGARCRADTQTQEVRTLNDKQIKFVRIFAGGRAPRKIAALTKSESDVPRRAKRGKPWGSLGSTILTNVWR